MLILPLAEGQQAGWPNWMLMLLVLSFPVLGIFVIYERRKRTRERTPLVDMDLFRASVVRCRHTINPPLLRYSKRALLHARSIPTIRSRILA